MAVTYMRKLEEEPNTYHENFTKLTKGVNVEVQDWILNKVGKNKSILEIGCGPGVLSKKLAQNGNQVTAIDQNQDMIDSAKRTLTKTEGLVDSAQSTWPLSKDMQKPVSKQLIPPHPIYD